MEAAPVCTIAEGFKIRAYQAGDGAALATAANASFQHLRPWMPWATGQHTAEQSEEYIVTSMHGYAVKTDFGLGIWKGDHLVGGTGFHLRWGPIEWGVAEIGMWIAAHEAGSGLGTAALRAMLDWGFTDWGWHRLIWRCNMDNYASARVAEKCGLTQEALLREDRKNVAGDRVSTKLYAIIRSDWEASRP